MAAAVKQTYAQRKQVISIGCMGLNLVSSIGIVFCNKQVFLKAGFTFGTTLTMIHFFVSLIGMYICKLLGLFEPKKLPLKEVSKIALSSCGFVVLTNLSLQHNSVAFYQIMKVLTTPYITIVQMFFYQKTFSQSILVSLFITCVGAAMASYEDYQFNTVGLIYALAAIVVTSHYQIWVGELQKTLECNSMQLLFCQLPLSIFMLLFIIPCFDKMYGKNGLLEYVQNDLNEFNFSLILLSGVIAFFVNLSVFLVIGKASPITYNVLGHSKLIIIITGGFVIFNAPFILNQLIGISIALVGVFLYTYYKLSQSDEVKPNREKLVSLPIVSQNEKIDTTQRFN